MIISGEIQNEYKLKTKIALWEYKGIQEDIHSFCEKNYLTTQMLYNESNY